MRRNKPYQYELALKEFYDQLGRLGDWVILVEARKDLLIELDRRWFLLP